MSTTSGRTSVFDSGTKEVPVGSQGNTGYVGPAVSGLDRSRGVGCHGLSRKRGSVERESYKGSLASVHGANTSWTSPGLFGALPGHVNVHPQSYASKVCPASGDVANLPQSWGVPT